MLTKQPIDIRAQSIYLAYNICEDYPELLAELELSLQQFSNSELTSALRCAQRKKLALIQKKRK